MKTFWAFSDYYDSHEMHGLKSFLIGRSSTKRKLSAQTFMEQFEFTITEKKVWISGWSNIISLFCNLRTIKNGDQGNRTNDSSFVYFFTNEKFSIETLMEEIKPVMKKKVEFDNPDEPLYRYWKHFLKLSDSHDIHAIKTDGF